MDCKDKKIEWNYDKCYAVAKECCNVTEFRETFYAAYYHSRKNGWLNDYAWFENGRRDIHKQNYVIYAYEDNLRKCVYVGLTNNIQRRKIEHKKKNYKNTKRKYDRIRDYFETYNTPVPEPLLLIEGIDGLEAQEKEKFFIEQYKERGWTILNLSKTGKNSSSLGNIGSKWTYERCRETIKLCKNRREAYDKYGSMMENIKKNGWFELLPPKQKHCTLTLEECILFCQGFLSVDELKKNNNEVYKRIKNQRWIKTCFPRKVYDEKKCRELAHNYENFTTICRLNKDLAYSIRKLGIKKLEYKEKPSISYTFEEAQELCKFYKNRTVFLRENYVLYKYCFNKGWIDKLFPSKYVKWTLEECIAEAKKYNSRYKFRVDHHQAYYALKDADLLDELLPKQKPVPPKRNFSPPEETYLKMAMECSTLNEFRKRHKTAYKFCRDNNLLEKTGLIEESKKITISREECYDAALKCQYKREFRTLYPREYRMAATVYFMLKEFIWLKGCKKEYTEKDCYGAARMCVTKKEFREKYPKEYKKSLELGILKNFTWFKKH